ncbi:hypothetical protein ACGFIV_00810 [Sphaerisporangium sp. NPDC049003]|uniref:hypothetical protein n=1 Tax=Sphaerisporangium sp. NPDC049003 TaxID=3364517 RepID=UPI003710DE10
MIYVYVVVAFIVAAVPYAALIGAVLAVAAGLVRLGSRFPVYRRPASRRPGRPSQ